MVTSNINGVEIFSAGVWNGDKYTVDDLHEMVKAFGETSAGYRPYLKLGHNNEQPLLQSDGLPAAGYVGELYVEGDKLKANFVDIPQKIATLISSKAYRKVSCEIYWGVKFDGKKYKFMLGAVALLGADMPGVHNLDDIISLYGLKDYETVGVYTNENEEFTVKQYTIENDLNSGGEMSKTEKELELEAKLQKEEEASLAKEAELKKFKADLEAKDRDNSKNEERIKALEAKLFAQEQEAQKALIESQADTLLSEKLITKGMRPFVVQLLGEEPETKKYSFKSGDKEQELSKFELVKELAKQFAANAAVNLEENSVDGDVPSENENKQLEEVEKYAQEHKVSFSEAYKAVFKGKLAQTPASITQEDND